MTEGQKIRLNGRTVLIALALEGAEEGRDKRRYTLGSCK